MTEAGQLSFLLQISDAMFPTGAYAHSFGMEEMIREGRIADEVSLMKFLQTHVTPALVHVDLPIVAEAQRAAQRGDSADLWELDRLAGALRPARELRAASLQTGRRRLAVLSAVRPTSILTAYQAMVEHAPNAGHHAVVWGAACAGLSASAAMAAYYYQTMAGYCAAAPKLLRIGQEAAQRVLTALLAESGPALECAATVKRADIGWFDPLLDIASMRHEIADERLFIS